DHVSQPVVDLLGYPDGGVAILDELDSWLNVREHLHVDSRRIHATDPPGTEIAEAVLDGSISLVKRRRKQLPEFWMDKGLFKSYDARGGLVWSHTSSPHSCELGSGKSFFLSWDRLPTQTVDRALVDALELTG